MNTSRQDNTQQLHITAWPDTRLEPPRIPRLGLVLSEGRYVEYRPPHGDIQVLEELAIRELLSLDASDAEAVVAFVSAHGYLAPSSIFELPAKQRPLGAETHWGQMAVRLRRLQFLSRFAVAYLDGQDVGLIGRTELDRGDLFPLDEEAIARGVQQDDKAVASLSFAWRLNDGLSVFASHVSVWMPDGTDASTPREVDLYNVVCLQIFNLLQDELPTKKCTNVTCPNIFVRQRGGAPHGQHRTVRVEYCSRSCANAAAQRKWRERKRKAQPS